MPSFDTFINELKEEIINQAKISFSDFPDAAEADTFDAILHLKNDLKRLTMKLSQGSLTPEGFVALVTPKKDKMAYTNLTQSGVASERTEQFKDYLLSLIINRTIETFM